MALTRREAIGLLSATAALGVIAQPRRAIIRTILADLPPDALRSGATMFHEHLGMEYSSPPRPTAAPRQPAAAPPGEARSVGLLIDEMRAARYDGVHAVVDASISRPRSEQQLEDLRTIARQSAMHIILAGGYISAPYPPAVIQMSEDEIAAHLVHDANAQRWGAFGEIGTSESLHDDERKFLGAVSKAHLAIGLPIFTHTPHSGCGRCARQQFDLFESKGVNPQSICIGHLSDITAADEPPGRTATALARRGAFVGFDTVGHPLNLRSLGMNIPDIPEAQKVKMVLAVLEAGFEDRILLSADFYNSAELKANWGSGFSTVLLQFVPKLRYAGVKEETIRRIIVDNPRRFLAFVPPSS
jgi:phosphotriesterase-related protein